MNDRGQYGPSLTGPALVGQIPQGSTIYVERKSSSAATWILGAVAVGGAVLWARHQSRQVEQLYKSAGLPQQSFVADLRQSARSFPAKASASLHGLAERVRPKKSQP